MISMLTYAYIMRIIYICAGTLCTLLYGSAICILCSKVSANVLH